MVRRKWLALLAVCMMLSGMLWGCAKAEPQVPEEQIPQPPSVSREGWQGYPVAGLTIYLPEMFEEGRIFEDYGEFLSQDEDFEGEYIQLEILSGLEAEWDTPVTDAPALAKDIRTRVEEDEGAVYATGTYWDVTYLIYSESDSKQDCALVGLYVRDGRGWMVQITGIDLERAAQMVPYVCGGAFATPAGWDAGSDNWMAYSVAGLGIRVPGEMLEEADFYPDCAYFVDSQSDTELEVMSGSTDEFESEIRDANMLADWFEQETQSSGDTVLTRGEENGVPYLVYGDGEDATLVGFYVSGEEYWVIVVENVAAQPEEKWIAMVTGGEIG